GRSIHSRILIRAFFLEIFFFQAEDGIRDFHVTGVQTCALPISYSWYLAGLVFKWLKEQGGVKAMGEMNARKASKLYDFIDTNDFYANPIAPRFRSWMNVPFTLADDALNGEFLKGADARGLLNLQGHRSVA